MPHPRVEIDGLLYVPITDVHKDIREAVARELLATWHGEVGPTSEALQAEMADYADWPVTLVEDREAGRRDITVSKFIDNVVLRIRGER